MLEIDKSEAHISANKHQNYHSHTCNNLNASIKLQLLMPTTTWGKSQGTLGKQLTSGTFVLSALRMKNRQLSVRIAMVLPKVLAMATATWIQKKLLAFC